MRDLKNEDYNDGYYHFAYDVEKYPDAWCYMVYSRRGPGKTYSALRYTYANNIKFAYIKRTDGDVSLICSSCEGFETSPFAPLNRDFNLNVRAIEIKKGIAGFYNCDSENNPVGAPVGIIFSMNSIAKYKGFDMSDVEYMIWDEFIPQRGEVVKKAEGDMALSAYMTISRDRQKRGRQPLRLVLFANSENIVCPMTDELEVIDTVADMNASGESYYETRGIMIHHITDDEVPLADSEKSGIFEAMKETAWGRRTWGGDFASNDFSRIAKKSLKGGRIMSAFRYKHLTYYEYIYDDGTIYISLSGSADKCRLYDINNESDAMRFYYERAIAIRSASIEGRVLYQVYSAYDIIINYRKKFSV